MKLIRDNIALDKDFPFQISEVVLNHKTADRIPFTGTVILRSLTYRKDREIILSTDRSI